MTFELTYIVTAEDRTMRDGDNSRKIILQGSSGEPGVSGILWDATATEQNIGGEVALFLEIPDDAFAAFEQCPALFAALREHRPRSVADLRRILVHIGARDVTERWNPNPEMFVSMGRHLARALAEVRYILTDQAATPAEWQVAATKIIDDVILGDKR